MEERKVIEDAGWNLKNSYANLPTKFYSNLNPTPVNSPKLVVLNEPLAKSLGLNPQALQSKEGVEVFAGNRILAASLPLAQAYAGHQFGHFTMLGDGRAILLGEHITPKGERFDIQLKGSGRTPYSRGGDGRAALGPMLREYIISEAMHALRIPTTRSLAVVATGEPVFRDMVLPGAILTRVASSHIRVGTFQYISKWGTINELRSLADYTLQRHFPDACEENNRYFSLLEEVIKRQAYLIAKWQLVGFIHGVMNTDNMVLSGETIDYGPCAFMDIYNPSTVFSSIDARGRYAYGNQVNIAAWNLERFAETLLPLLCDNLEDAAVLAQEAVSGFFEIYHGYWINGMRAKLGLFNQELEDEILIEDLYHIMQKYRGDYTNTFRALTLKRPEGTTLLGTDEFVKWYERWQARLSVQKETNDQVHQLMRYNNPSVIPRNHRVEEALNAAVNNSDYSVMEKLLKVLQNPYGYTKDQDEYAVLPELSACPYQTFCGT
nr:YdiU family protein [uncultured Aminipila sp.]